MNTSPVQMPAAPAAPAAPTTPPARLFISGHSLTDRPIPDFLAEIAQSLGKPLQWNRQYVVGSAIVTRTRGDDPKAGGWSGYRSGLNREGEGLDVIGELRAPKTVSGGLYDALLITEQHGLLGSLDWADTVRYLRHFHERLIEANPRATSYFYESWLGLDDKNRPARWIAYERAASPIWQCIVTRINTSLGAEGRADRIRSLPAGAALAELIDRATRPAGVAGITRGTVRETVDSLISDDVHLTPLGAYYSALVTYVGISGQSPVGAWRPATVASAQADALQRVAWEFMSAYTKTNVPLSLGQCQSVLRESFISTYWSYVRDTAWSKEVGALQARGRWLRHVAGWHWRMRRSNASNPFHFDPATDRGYWLPAP